MIQNIAFTSKLNVTSKKIKPENDPKHLTIVRLQTGSRSGIEVDVFENCRVKKKTLSKPLNNCKRVFKSVEIKLSSPINVHLIFF